MGTALPVHANLECGRGGTTSRTCPLDLNVPVTETIDGALIYIVDGYGDGDIYQFDFIASESNSARSGITYTLAIPIVCIWASWMCGPFIMIECSTSRKFVSVILRESWKVSSKEMACLSDTIRIPINEWAGHQH